LNFLNFKKIPGLLNIKLFKNLAGIPFHLLLLLILVQNFLPGNLFARTEKSISVSLDEVQKLIDKKSYVKADTLLFKIIKSDSQYQEPSGKSAWYLLGLIREKRGEPKEAIQTWLKGLEVLRNKSRPDLYLKYHLARLFAESNIQAGMEQITRLFYEVLDDINPEVQPDLWELILDQSRILLSEQELLLLKKEIASGSKHPGRLLKIAFKREDPSPMTLGNEYVYKFFQRVAAAQKKFSDKLNPRGYDDRGDIFVLLGQPSRMFYRRSGTRGAMGYALYPYEIWFYKQIHPDLFFTFIGKMGKDYYTLVDGPESIFGLFYRGHRTFFNRQRDAQTAVYLRSELYMTIAPLHKSFQERLQRMEQEPTLYDALEYALQHFPDEDREHAALTRELVSGLVLGADYSQTPLEVEFNWAGFRNGQKTRLEFYYLIPYEEMIFSMEPYYQTTVRSEIGVFDDDYNLIVGDSAKIVVTPPPEKRTEGLGFISQFTFEVAPGTYWVVFKVSNFTNEERKERIFTTRIHTEPFLKDSLSVSDIEFAQNIHISEEQSIFLKNNLFVLPLPSKKHDLSLPLFVYFEIYNLTLDANKRSRYNIELRLSRLKSKKGIFNRISSILKSRKEKKVEYSLNEEKTGNSNVQQEYFQLDISKLPPDEYTIELIVKDQLSSQVVCREKTIKLIKE